MKVSVHIVTYNHEKYIAQALDSVLMQEVNFDYEIVIGEDCSTDNTRQIVIDYQHKHPDKIRALLHEKNIGGIENEIATYNTCNGQYIAWLEGDDYWTSPHKLQKQVDFLDTHPDHSCCFHPIIDFYEDGSKEPRVSPSWHQQRELLIEDLLEGPIMHTAAVMSRKFSLPDWYENCVFGDWELTIFFIQQGRIGCIDEVMATYRRNAGSSYHGSDQVSKLTKRIKLFEQLNPILEYKYNKNFVQKISLCYHELALEYEKNGDLREARSLFMKSLIKSPFNKYIERISRYRLFARLYLPMLKS